MLYISSTSEALNVKVLYFLFWRSLLFFFSENRELLTYFYFKLGRIELFTKTNVYLSLSKNLLREPILISVKFTLWKTDLLHKMELLKNNHLWTELTSSSKCIRILTISSLCWDILQIFTSYCLLQLLKASSCEKNIHIRLLEDIHIRLSFRYRLEDRCAEGIFKMFKVKGGNSFTKFTIFFSFFLRKTYNKLLKCWLFGVLHYLTAKSHLKTSSVMRSNKGFPLSKNQNTL